MEKTFEEKVAIVASAFYNRFEEEGEPEILQKIFENHDMSGAIALALVGGDVELVSDEPKKWIEATFEVLSAVFDFPDEVEQVETEKPVAKKATAKKKAEPKA